MKVAIYCRLSEEDRNKKNKDDDSESIQNQKTMLLQYAMDHDWEVIGIYSDDDYTGSDRRRPEFNRLLADAEARKFDIILCKTQSRFTRELELVEKYIHGLFPIWGIRFVSVVDNADTANKGNKKSRQINGLVNEWYLEDMSENIRSVLTNKRINGQHIGAFALYGYRKDPDQKGHLIIDEEAAAVVREVFRLFADGYGKTAIARILNERGIPNPTEYKRLHGLRFKQPTMKNSTLWKYFAISDMLTNEIYIGNMVQGKYGSISYKSKINKPRPKESWYIVEGTHEPIIDRELWDKVQQIVATRAKPCYTGKVGIFAKKVMCRNCGYTMRSSKNRGKHYLQCSNRHVAKDACIGSFISQEKLEQIILDELKSLSEKYLDRDELEANVDFCTELTAKREKLQKEINAYEKQIDDYAGKIKMTYMDKLNGVITENDFLDLTREFSADKERLLHTVAETQKQIDSIDNRLAAGDNRREIIEQYLHIDHLTRSMVELLVDHITVGKRQKGEKAPPIEIHWNF